MLSLVCIMTQTTLYFLKPSEEAGQILSYSKLTTLLLNHDLLPAIVTSLWYLPLHCVSRSHLRPSPSLCAQRSPLFLSYLTIDCSTLDLTNQKMVKNNVV